MGSIRLRYYCIGLATWRRDECQQRKISPRMTFHRHSSGSRAKVRAGVDRAEFSLEIGTTVKEFPERYWKVSKPQEMALESASLESASNCAKSTANSIFLHLEMAPSFKASLLTNTREAILCTDLPLAPRIHVRMERGWSIGGHVGN